MHLLSGPAGSGKTRYILDRLRARLNGPVRLLVPTATMAQHLQNQLAREGRVFRRAVIQTLSAFVRELDPVAEQVSKPILYLLTEDAARRAKRSEFRDVLDLPGFHAALARTIEEFASAGCDSARLAACLPDAPLAEAFVAVYREVDEELARRGLAMRARRLEFAAQRIAREGLRGIETVWVDGFRALPDPELAVIAAMGKHADLTLALDDLDLTAVVRDRLNAIGFTEERPQGAVARHTRAAVQVFQAPGIERETEEIARRILEQAGAGRAFREMGIVVRAEEAYVPVLRATLARFGIPARFYFETELEHHPAVRFLCGAIDAMLSGWDHQQTLSVLRLAPRFAASGAMDRFDFAVRKQMPNAGLAGLHAALLDKEGQLFGGAERLKRKLDSLAALEEWRGFSLHPKHWAARFGTLRNLFRPDRPADTASHDWALDWRGQAAALDAFDEALQEAALSLDAAHEIAIEPWWRAVKSVLRLKALRVDDRRRNVVHVMSAFEARQWSLPLMFVCGMVEKQFPKVHSPDPFFSDSARCRLNDAGVRVRTAAEFERQERVLFESALARASMLVTLSWPAFDARGETNLKSLFLEELLTGPAADSRPVRPAAGNLARKPAAAGIRDEALLPILREKSAVTSPTALESFLQCPFQYFAGKTLRLRPAPLRPEERLDFLTQGNIVHQVLKEWWNQPQPIAAVFERVLAGVLAERHIPFGYHTERLRNQMLDDLTRFASDHSWQRDAFRSQTEAEFQFPIGEVTISGKIDRLDTGPGGQAYVIDYKYSSTARAKARVKNENLLQAPLYLLAAEQVFHARPEGMFYLGLKGEILYVGWSGTQLLDSLPMPENWLAATRERTLRIVGEIRSGRADAAPADTADCRFCDYRDACRVEVKTAAAQVEGA